MQTSYIAGILVLVVVVLAAYYYWKKKGAAPAETKTLSGFAYALCDGTYTYTSSTPTTDTYTKSDGSRTVVTDGSQLTCYEVPGGGSFGVRTIVTGTPVANTSANFA